MSAELTDRGRYLQLNLIGYGYVDSVVDLYGESLNYDGLMIGLVIENHSNETCTWNGDSLEIIDENGFAYTVGNGKANSYLGELLPGGWYLNQNLRELKSNRKYRLAAYFRDFHGQPTLISYEDRVLKFTDPEEVERMMETESLEIDLSAVPTQSIESVPELDEALSQA